MAIYVYMKYCFKNYFNTNFFIKLDNLYLETQIQNV